MATIINNPGEHTTEDSGLGLMIGVLLAIVLLAVFFVYILPAIRNSKPQSDQGGNINLNVTTPNPISPSPTPSSPSPTPSGGY